MKDVGLAILGSGYMGRTYTECAVKHVRNVRLVTLGGGSRAPKLAADYGIELSTSFDQMLARQDVDAVLIATPHTLHVSQVEQAAKAGKHVLVEKPMGLSAAECRRMIDACRQAGVTLSVIQTVRFRGTVARGKKLIDEGRIGDVRMIELRALFEWVPISGQTWSEQPGEGGLILDQGAHNFDFMRWYAGSEASQVFGRIVAFSGGSYPEPTAMAQVNFANGVIAQTWMSFELPKPGIVNHQFRAVVVGSKGMLDIDGFGKLSGSLDGAPWDLIWEQPEIDYVNKPLHPNRLEAFFTQIQDFVDSIREQRPPAVTGEDGLATISLIDAVRRSSATGEAVVPQAR